METRRSRAALESRAEPFFWWGPGWASPQRRDLGSLLRDGTIDVWTTAQLWAALARRRSLAVVSGPSGVGKTTLLTALLELLPAGTRRIYVRGCFETFAFLDDPEIDPRRTALLVNELSPHLPVYLWGPGVARLASAARHGFAILATAHAASGLEFAGTLAGAPLRLPADQVAAFEFVAAIAPAGASASGRRVTGMWRLAATPGGGIAVESLAAFTAPGRTVASPSQPWFPPSEIETRARLLTAHREGLLATLPVVGIVPDQRHGAERDAP